MPAGYSGTPLVKKLGIKPGDKLFFHHPPERYFEHLPGLPEDAQILNKPASGLNFIQFFTKTRQELEAEFPTLKLYLAIDGMLWIS